MKSMTGFGKAEYVDSKRKYTIEIKTLNSKQLDLIIKIPNTWKDKEVEIRNLLINQLQRGKIELHVTVDDETEKSDILFDEDVIVNYYSQLKNISDKNNIPLSSDILGYILQLQGSLRSEKHNLDDNQWNILFDAIQKALNQVNQFRTQEGYALMQDTTKHIDLIERYLSDIEQYDPQRIEFIKNRLRQNLAEHLGEHVIDQNRFEQELIYYLEKIDITEEKVRLRNHCSYFKTTMNETDSIGKKLGFITQEIGREINTIGSKANNTDIQISVVKMKNELEKIKEQMLNVL
jgi:uncharacterized protein (TIGR00255 family)